MKKLFTLAIATAMMVSITGLQSSKATCSSATSIFSWYNGGAIYYFIGGGNPLWNGGGGCGILWGYNGSVTTPGTLTYYWVSCGYIYEWSTCFNSAFPPTTGDTEMALFNAQTLARIAYRDDGSNIGAMLCAGTVTPTPFFRSQIRWTADFTGNVYLGVVRWSSGACTPANSFRTTERYALLMRCTATAGCAPPVNDNLCDALMDPTYELDPSTGCKTINFNTANASVEPGEPSPGAGSGSNSCGALDGWCAFETALQRTLWYSFIAPPSGNVCLTAGGPGNPDTQLAIWRDLTGGFVFIDCFSSTPQWGFLGEVAANDDAVGAPFIGFSARICAKCGEFGLNPGETYFIQLDQFGTLARSGTLTICSEPMGTPAPNATCATAVSVSCGSVTAGSNTCGKSPTGVGTFCGVSLNKGVWYKIAGTGNGMTAQTCSPGSANYDTQISVFRGSCSGLVCVGGNDDACSLLSRFNWCTTAGTDYYIFVHGFAGGVGNFSLNVNCHAPLVANAGADQEANAAYSTQCGSATLSGSASGGMAPYTYAWTGPSGAAGSTASIDVCVNTTTTFTLCITDAAGCSSCDQVTVFVDPTGNVDNYVMLATAANTILTGPNDVYTGALGVNVSGGNLRVFNDNTIGWWVASDNVRLGPNSSICGVYYDASYQNNNSSTTVIAAQNCNPGCPSDNGNVDAGLVVDGWAGGYTSCINGTIAQRATLVNELPEFTTGTGANGPVTVANGASATIAPGDYTSITLGQGSTLLLDKGTYTATSIYTGPDATLASSTGDAGDVQIHVSGDARLKNKNTNTAVMIYASGEIEFGPNAVAEGKFIAASINTGGGASNVYTKSDASWLNCVDITVKVQTDLWGNEITWTLSNCDGPIASGGPYPVFAPALFTTTVPCNDPGDCYTFKINDAFGDGICCFWGAGNYTVTFGDVSTSSPSGGAYGGGETITFGDCSSTCELEACVSVNGFGDEISWTLTNEGNNAVVASHGPQNYGSTTCGSAVLCGGGGTYRFNIESQGFFNDNTGSFNVTCNGSSIASGSFLGGQTHVRTGLACCNGTPKSDAPALEAQNANESGVVATNVSAYPNPFSGSTTISFTLSAQANVSLEVYNTAGARVATLFNDVAQEGFTSVVFDANDLPVGVYMYRLTAGTNTYHGKLSIVK